MTAILPSKKIECWAHFHKEGFCLSKTRSLDVLSVIFWPTDRWTGDWPTANFLPERSTTSASISILNRSTPLWYDISDLINHETDDKRHGEQKKTADPDESKNAEECFQFLSIFVTIYLTSLLRSKVFVIDTTPRITVKSNVFLVTSVSIPMLIPRTAHTLWLCYEVLVDCWYSDVPVK